MDKKSRSLKSLETSETRVGQEKDSKRVNENRTGVKKNGRGWRREERRGKREEDEGGCLVDGGVSVEVIFNSRVSKQGTKKRGYLRLDFLWDGSGSEETAREAQVKLFRGVPKRRESGNCEAGKKRDGECKSDGERKTRERGLGPHQHREGRSWLRTRYVVRWSSFSQFTTSQQ